jgi:hypothetical protein
VGVGFQPAAAALLVLAQLPIVGPIGLLGGHRKTTRQMGRLVVAAPQPAKHAARLASGGLLVGGQDLLRFLAVGGGAGQLAGAIMGGLVELAAQPVPLGPQLTSRHSLRSRLFEVSMARGLAASPGQGLGQMQVAVGLLPIRQVQLPVPWRSGPTTAYRRVSCRARDSCTYSQLTSSLPLSRTSARPRVSPWARWPVMA